MTTRTHSEPHHPGENEQGHLHPRSRKCTAAKQRLEMTGIHKTSIALPLVDGPKEYRVQRDLFERPDEVLSRSGLEQEFTSLSLAHRQIDLKAGGLQH